MIKNIIVNSIKNAVHSIVGCIFERTRLLLYSGYMRFSGKDLLIVSRSDYSPNLFQETRVAVAKERSKRARVLFAVPLYSGHLFTEKQY